ncbi:hypothetical protein ACOQJ6_34095, partial [Klebsiella pneumoniae]|uniref:hypothetical protein n=1 Tax=Klebsiella pneumoniae TaxID=573 RepID=UPI00301860D8
MDSSLYSETTQLNQRSTLCQSCPKVRWDYVGEKVTEEWGLWLVAIYTELVFEAVPGRWRIAFW